MRTSTLDSYRKFAGYLSADLGSLPVIDVGAETLTTWQSTLLDRFAPYTVLTCRKVCRQAFAEAVKVGLIPSNPFNLVRAPQGKRVSAGRALSTNEAKALITAAQSLRLGAAVTLLFVQGWRVSEVLGLAWDDLDLDAGTAQIRRGAAYTPSVGTVLGSTKTSGAEGIHYVAPISVAHLHQRRAEQDVERERLPVTWPIHRFDGIALSMVFTTMHGGLVNRQSVTKEIERAKIAGIAPTGLSSHSGRRTVITALYADGRVRPQPRPTPRRHRTTSRRTPRPNDVDAAVGDVIISRHTGAAMLRSPLERGRIAACGHRVFSCSALVSVQSCRSSQ